MGGPLSLTLVDIHMIRTENDIVKPLKPLFYKRYVDDIYSRRKKNCTGQLYHELNNNHPNINLTNETNPKKFLDNQVLIKNGKIETAVYRKSTKLPCHGHQIYLNSINETQLTQTYIVQNGFLQTLIRKFTESKRTSYQQIIHKNLLKVSSITLKMIK